MSLKNFLPAGLLAVTLILCLLLSGCTPPPREHPDNNYAKILAQYNEKLKQRDKFIYNTKYKIPLPLAAPQFPYERTGYLYPVKMDVGKLLFYDKLLSKNNSIACASCHKQEYAFADNRQFSLGVNGKHTGFNSMPLVNLAYFSRYFWNGRVIGLHNQVLHPITNPNEMNLTVNELLEKINSIEQYQELFSLVYNKEYIDKEMIAEVISQFLFSLVSFEAPIDHIRQVEYGVKRIEDLPKTTQKGLLRNLNSIFGKMNYFCGQCHVRVMYGEEIFANNGLPKSDLGLYSSTKLEEHRGAMKVPALRFIKLTAPYMHDGRFNTLEEVIDYYANGIVYSKELDKRLIVGNQVLPLQELVLIKKQLIDVLDLWTDPKFLKEPLFGEPNKPNNKWFIDDISNHY